MASWFVVRGEKEQGPLTAAQLKEMATAGKLRREDLVRRDDLQTPRHASEIKGLFPDIHDKVRTAADAVGRRAETVKKVAENVGMVADAVNEVADSTEKIRQAAMNIFGIAGGVSTLAGSIGDFLRPLGNINLVVFLLASSATPVCVVLARRQTKNTQKFKYGASAVVAFAMAAIFGLWSGLAAIGSKGDKGVLATNVRPIDRLQEAVVPAPVAVPPVAVPPDKALESERASIDFDPVVFFTGDLNDPAVEKSRRVTVVDGKVGKVGKVGKAAAFNEKGFILLRGNCPAGNSPRTMAAWIRNTRGPVKELIHVLQYGPVKPKKVFGIIEAEGRWRFFDLGGGLNSGVAVDTEWHHHCICYDGKQITYYFDGKPVAKVERELATEGKPLLLGAQLQIGDNYKSKSFAGHIAGFLVYDRAITPDQVKIVMNGEYKTPRESPAQRNGNQTFKGHTAYVTHVAVAPDGLTIATGSNDHTVRLWDRLSGRQIWKCSEYSTNIFAVAFSSEGNRVWTACRDSAKRLDVSSGVVSKEMKFDPCGHSNVPGVAFGGGCSRLAVSGKGNVACYDTWRGKRIAREDAKVPCVSFGKSTGEVFIGGNEGAGQIKLWQMQGRPAKRAFSGLRDRTISLCLSQDGRMLAASSGPALPKHRPAENKIVVWEVSSGRRLHEFHISSGWQYGLSFSHDNRLLAAGGSGTEDDWFGQKNGVENSVRVWNLETGKEVSRFTGHTGAVLSTAFTPDGKFLLSASADSTVKMWPLD